MLIIMCISRDIPESWELKTETEKRRCKQQNKKKVENPNNNNKKKNISTLFKSDVSNCQKKSSASS